MARTSLIEAFRADVLDRPDFKAAIRAAVLLIGRENGGRAGLMLDGIFPAETGMWWCDAGVSVLYDLWFAGEGSAAGDDRQERIDAARRAAFVLRRFLDPLKAGAVQCFGVPTDRTIPAEIPAAVWQRLETRFDVVSGQLGRLVEEAEDRHADRIIVEWTAVEIDFGASDGTEEKSRGGRTPKYQWDIAFNMAFDYVNRYGMPASGADFSRLIYQALSRTDANPPDPKEIGKEVKRRNPDFYRYLVSQGKDLALMPEPLKPLRGGES